MEEEEEEEEKREDEMAEGKISLDPVSVGVWESIIGRQSMGRLSRGGVSTQQIRNEAVAQHRHMLLWREHWHSETC